jgi:hypothetical protein
MQFIVHLRMRFLLPLTPMARVGRSFEAGLWPQNPKADRA